MPTIKDVAKVAGVSIATVSYVLNDRLEMVSEQTREHVLSTAREMGYRPNITARNLQANRAGLIGYAWHIAPEALEASPMMAQFMFYLAQAVEAAGYHMLTFTHPPEDPIAVYDDLIRSGRIDGFVLAETRQADPRVAFLLESDVPFVCFGRTNNDWQFPWVDTDGRAGMRRAVDYLAGIGHKRIAFMGWPNDSLSGNDRLAGYLEGMQALQLPVAEAFLFQSDYPNGQIDRILAAWQGLAATERPTAVIVIADYIAIEVIRAAERHGFTVGKTLSVVGFDGIPIGQVIQPGLTTLHQPMQSISQALLDLFKDSLTAEGRGNRSRLIAPELIIRESSGPPQAD